MTQETLPLDPADKATLRRQAITVWIAGPLIGVAAYFILSAFPDSDMRWVKIIFGIFFFGILAFILFATTLPLFANEKLIYTGRVTKKEQEVYSTGGKTNSSNRRYHVELDGEKVFDLSLGLYTQVSQGDLVELHCTTGIFKNFFKVVVLDAEASTFQAPAHTPFYSTALDSPSIISHETYEEIMSDADKKILRARFIKAVIWRVVVAGVAAFLLWFVLSLLVVSLLWKTGQMEGEWLRMQIILYGPITLLVTALVILNLKTWRILSDWIAGFKKVSIERVLDIVHSNTPMASEKIIVTGTGMRGDYHYVKTPSHWILVPPHIVQGLNAGHNLRVHYSPRADIVLYTERV